MGIECQIISLKFKFSNICKLKTHDTRKRSLLIKFEEYRSVRKRIINFHVFYTVVCKFCRRLYWQMYGKQKNPLRFLTQLHSSNLTNSLLSSIVTFQFTNAKNSTEFHRNYLKLDSHTNTVLGEVSVSVDRSVSLLIWIANEVKPENQPVTNFMKCASKCIFRHFYDCYDQNDAQLNTAHIKITSLACCRFQILSS